MPKISAAYCEQLKIGALSTMFNRKKQFDYDKWPAGVRATIEKACDRLRGEGVPISADDFAIDDEPRLRRQLELLNELKQNPKPLLMPDSAELDPIRHVISALSDQLSSMQKGFERFRCIVDFLQKRGNDALRAYLSALCCLRPAPVFRLHDMMRGGVFAVTIDQARFLDVMSRYFRLKNERNHSNHARHDLGEFATAEELKQFIEAGLDELEEALRR